MSSQVTEVSEMAKVRASTAAVCSGVRAPRKARRQCTAARPNCRS